MSGRIHFYGERGLVNATFLDLRSKDKLSAFLRTIEFSFRERPRLDVPNESKIIVIVEAGFGGNRAGFGWPDAVICARTPTAHLVLFLEAKAGLYRDEAEDFTATRAAGFNSTINGQFSLRYRLAAALRGHCKGRPRLIEPQDLARAYGEERLPRRLAKPENLRDIIEPHLLGAAEYLFVALTDDDANPWPAAQEDATTLPFLAEPVPLGTPSHPWTADRNNWQDNRARFGWVGFRAVESLVKGGDFFPLAYPFLEARRRAQGRGASGEVEPGAPIQPQRWERAPRPEATRALRDRLRGLMREATVGLGLRFEPGNGSDSLIGPGGRRLLKLIAPIPRYNAWDILLGVAIGLGGFPELLRGRALGTVRIQRRGFEICGIKDSEFGAEELRELIRDTISNVTDQQETAGTG